MINLKLVKYLAKFGENHDLIFTSLEICRATLEDAFVKLTEGDSHAN